MVCSIIEIGSVIKILYKLPCVVKTKNVE